ncbi:MAG: OmpA family protein [Bacteroidia bacterium]|nr:OmpA family protein [Bacteroidia bacterium]MDW8346670.1 OmpA family protein [Bacteroidia bacterium]
MRELLLCLIYTSVLFGVQAQPTAQKSPVLYDKGEGSLRNEYFMPTSGTIMFYDVITKTLVATAEAKQDGTFNVKLPRNRRLYFEIKSGGRLYKFDGEDYELYTSSDNDPLQLLRLDFVLNPRYLKEGSNDSKTSNNNIVLNKVHFDPGSANLRPESYEDLNTVVDLLKSNPDLRIEIQGHTDNQGDKQKNMQLSQERAMSVKNYLVKKGIDPSRIDAVGYGDTQPIASNDTEANRQKNRRIEYRVIR